jgi:hypothetical protein
VEVDRDGRPELLVGLALGRRREILVHLAEVGLAAAVVARRAGLEPGATHRGITERRPGGESQGSGRRTGHSGGYQHDCRDR